ncbi:Gfo/Idh/MocA family protein [Palleronia caenipelagi]|uniref:Gfo/Idh/MocA family oxidoreductase n=1 Tax=Palleronia caenipelagi TaxID=2489174 RepID=A0A547Q9K8_9RHOB|nr:Gfo/Idh/MocA family oxidoreductase [Palleronia caenipelagi]TRD23031.1 Gfo/Idh/MocA family oxidoreductase [Palleronia caenipelagi]
MVKRLTYGMIGCGMMGQEHLRNIALLEGVEVTRYLEPDPGMAGATARLIPRAIRAATIGDMLGHGDLDAVIIASPNYLHVPQIMEIANHRSLPLLVEKPLYTTPEQAEALQAIGYPQPIWVAMEYRYMPAIAAFLEHADAVTGGPVQLAIREHRFPFLEKVGDWNRFNAFSGGTFVEKCCHFFDLMRLILKSEPVRVMASAGQAVNHRDEDYAGRAPDILDSGFVIVEFENGSRAMLELCMFAEGSGYQEELSLVGPAGKIEALVPGPVRHAPTGQVPVGKVIVSPRQGSAPVTTEFPVDPNLLEAGDHNGATFFQHQRFAAMLRGQGAVEVTLGDGARAVAMGLAAQRSAETGQAVRLDDL